MNADDSAAVSLPYSVGEADEPMMTVIEAVAKFKGVDETSLAPLNEAIDVDALGALFGATDSEPTDLRVTFDYEGCEVLVEEDRVNVSTGE